MLTGARPDHASTRPVWLRPGWWLRDQRTGEVVLYQPPNALLTTWLGTAAVTRLVRDPGWRLRLGTASAIAGVAWGADELLRGTTPYRRLIGGLTMARQGWRALH